jgi:hypothetical protein
MIADWIGSAATDRNRREALRVIVPGSCEDGGATLVLVQLDAPAIELDLVEPRVTGRRPATLDG